MLRVISPHITPLASIIGLTFVGKKILVRGFSISCGRKTEMEDDEQWCIFNHSDRKVLAEDISASLPYIDDQDMAELMKQTVLLLEEMSEEDFSELVFVPAEEEDEPDWEGLI